MMAELVVVASGNPVKLKAVQDGFALMFPQRDLHFTTVSVPSGVSDQPMSEEETLEGAHNRILAAQARHSEAEFWVGIEGGLQENSGSLEAFAWVLVHSRRQRGQSRTGSFILPARVAKLVLGGLELGEADDRVFSRTDSKRGDGASGILTDGALDRTGFYSQSVVLALIPFKNPGLYPQQGD